MVRSALARSSALSLAKAFSIDGVAVRREEHEPRAGRLDCVPNAGGLVRRQVVHHDDISWRQGRHQNLLDIGQEHVVWGRTRSVRPEQPISIVLIGDKATAVEWMITIEGKNEFGDVCRREVRIDKSWERPFDGEIGLSIDDGKKIMAALQSAVVNHEAETYSLFRRVCPDCHTFRPVKDYTTRRIRTVFGTVEVRNPRWMLCRDCYPGMVVAFAPLKEICPDRATPELMELSARLGSMMPYRQAARVLAEFLSIEPSEAHATVRKRTIRIGERLRRPDRAGNMAREVSNG